jgi:hypothetical protein
MVYNTIDYRISITIRAEFGFIEIVKLRVKVINKIRYKNIFFLVKETIKILFS